MIKRLTPITLLVLIAILIFPSMTFAFDIPDARVFKDYLYENDWLVTCHYNNSLEPYYGNETSRSSFVLQFLNTTNSVIAQYPQTQWEYMPGSIYLANTTVSSLEWGSAYKVRLWGLDAGHNNTTYTLVPTDWEGADLSLLDDWCLKTAAEMETYYTETLLVDTAEKGTVLNEVGGAIFDEGIPYLSSIRPNIFQVVVGEMAYVNTSWSGAYETSLPDWNIAVGADFTAILTDAGTIMHLDGQQVGLMFFFLLYAGVATAIFTLGHGTAGMALALPILGVATYFRFMSFALMGVIVVIAAVFLMRQLWWSST